MDYNRILKQIYKDIEPFAKDGCQATYIPALANVKPDQFGIYLSTLAGENYSFGDSDTRFSI